jgi:hypothetical protein
MDIVGEKIRLCMETLIQAVQNLQEYFLLLCLRYLNISLMTFQGLRFNEVKNQPLE